MKQNPLPAKHLALTVFALGALVLLTTACVTQPRKVAAEVQLSVDMPNADRVSTININTASPQELEKLPGIGKVVAERIVSHRQQYGLFRRAEHLMMVRGISDRKFREMRPWIAVE